MLSSHWMDTEVTAKNFVSRAKVRTISTLRAGQQYEGAAVVTCRRRTGPRPDFTVGSRLLSRDVSRGGGIYPAGARNEVGAVYTEIAN
jgi:hypothetical protein